jgi:restriction system protein
MLICHHFQGMDSNKGAVPLVTILQSILSLFSKASAKVGDRIENVPPAAIASKDDEQFEGWLNSRETVERRIRALAAPHLKTFAIKYHQLTYEDDYGNLCVDKWYKELGYFVDKVLMIDEEIAACDCSYSSAQGKRDVVCRLLDVYLTGENWDSINKANDLEYHSRMDGVAFERLIADSLKSAGAEVRMTPATGDQGADILATLKGRSIAIQCKRSISPVGNKAVQEISAGKVFHGADEAWVIADAPFTPAARQLASSLSVSLIDFRRLAYVLENLT